MVKLKDFMWLQKNFVQRRADELIADQRKENIKVSKLYFRTREKRGNKK